MTTIHNIVRASFIAIVCFLTGCLSHPPLVEQKFLFAPAPPSTPATASGSRVLGIRSLEVAAPFEGRDFVYRTGDFSYEGDPYAEFMVPPADGLVTPICSWWRASGGFGSVAESGSALKPDTLVEIRVLQLYGDFRQAAKPAAVLTMRFIFFDATNGLPGNVILQKDYSGEIPLKTATAAAVIDGWNQALAQILNSAVVDFGQAEASAPKH